MTRTALVVRKPGLATAYQRGRSFEYVVKADLERRGGVVIRSAGSHTPADLVWCSRTFVRPHAVQCKGASGLSVAARKTFVAWCLDAGLTPMLACKVRGGFSLQRVLEDGSLVELP